MKELQSLKYVIGLGCVCALTLLLTISNTTVEQDNDQVIKQLSAELALVKAQMASHTVAATKEEVSAEPFIAEISMFGGNFAPRNWAFCEGQLLAISTNTALFSLIGTTYGGDGRTTFALPDLRAAEKQLQGKDGRGPRYIIALYGMFPSRN